MVWIQNGVPVVGKQNPGGDQKAVTFAACVDDLCQAVKFGIREDSAILKQTAGDEEETVRQYETAQAGHVGDYNTLGSAEFGFFKLCGPFWMQKPQSLKKPNSALPPTSTSFI